MDVANNDVFFRSIDFLKPSKAHKDALARLNIHCIKDLLFHTPNYYIEKNVFPQEPSLKAGQHVILKIIINKVEQSFGSRKPLKVHATITDNGAPLILIFFRKPPVFIKQLLVVGKTLTVEGKIEVFSHQYQLSHPEFILNDKSFFPVQPVYPLTYGITQKQIYRYILNALSVVRNSFINQYNDFFPVSFIDCLDVIHHKTSHAELNADKALYFAGLFELVANQLAFKFTKTQQQRVKGRSFISHKDTQQQILDVLNFTIAEGQEQVLQEIEHDQRQDIKMVRMLQGDVGSGKTLVALLSMLNVVRSGAQAVLMAPTDLLANQHYIFFSKALANQGIKVEILTGSTKVAERRRILSGLQSGEVNILLGTHALFQQGVEFNDLAYIVIDEQHRFGVQQRLDLINKSNNADLLVMTATPIPRTLALTLYGDMDVSRMNGKLRHRPPITTSVISTLATDDVMASLNKIIQKGEQVYWVCPLIENLGDEEQEPIITSVTERFEGLKEIYPEITGLLHGKLAAKSKNAVMESFSKGELKILTATTVIEVGIDVAAASLIVIEHAEKFGLAQLHQLRGRVGRSNKPSFCILLYDGRRCSNIARKRLEVMKNSQDGFEIAEQDLVLRGTGEMLGTKQSGELDLNFTTAESMRSFDLIKQANNIAEELFSKKEAVELTTFLNLFEKHVDNLTSG